MTFGSSLLSAVPGLRHAFFTREGGVSGRHLCQPQWRRRLQGQSRRCRWKIAAAWRRRWGSRRRVFSACTRPIRPNVVVATAPWPWRTRPRADAIVTRTEGLAIGVSAADCGPILFVDPSARVIGAAHAGWKGALTGVLESAIDAMEKLGADRAAWSQRSDP